MYNTGNITNITINNNIINTQNNEQAITRVPQPVSKNYGNECGNLVLSSQNKNPPKTPVSFGSLGSYVFGEEKVIAPPPRNLPPPPAPPKCKPIPPAVLITEAQAKEMLETWSKEKCCGSAKAAQDGHVNGVHSTNALHYVLETFTEKRSLVSTYGACRPGETISPPQGSSIVNPWLVISTPPNKFVPRVDYVACPHTEVLQPCFRCNSYGKLRCSSCNGSGMRRCGSCGGDGIVEKRTNIGQSIQVSRVTCGMCHGKGRVDCVRCAAGAIICDTCNGSQTLKWYLQIKIDYVNHIDEFINERTELPDELIKNYNGGVLLQCEGAQLMPISDCDSDMLNKNSLKLIENAVHAYSQEKQLCQRHVLKTIAVAECDCTYNTNDYKFWIIGQEMAIHAPDYPTQCCCTCCGSGGCSCCCCTIV